MCAVAMCAVLVGCAGRSRAGRSSDAGARGSDGIGDGARRTARYLALGDSYTIGERVDSAARWPVQLAALLRERGIAVAAPTIIARTGWTTDELSVALDRANPRGTFDLVSLLIGVNNQYRGRDVEEYRAQFRALLQRAVAFAGGDAGRVIVLSIPDWGVTPFAEKQQRDGARIASEIDRFNAVNREETERAAARYVDVTPISRAASADRTLIAEDGLHPSGKMYGEWARLALPPVLAALGA